MSGAINRERLAALRAIMTAEKIDYYLIPTADYHNSEYVAPFFQTRHYFSGFSGSSGTLVVGRKEAGLWTDGRYFIQAEKELTGTGVDLYRDMEEGVPTVSEWLADRLSEKAGVAVPEAVNILRTALIRHNIVCNRNEMKQEVRRFLEL